MLGVFLDRDSLDHDDLDMEELYTSVPQWRFYPATSPEQTTERIAEAEIVVCNKVVLDARALSKAKNLKLIAIAATGTNNVDLAEAQRRGILVCNVRKYATTSVVQHVLTLILALTRHLPEYQNDVIAGRWQQSSQFCMLDHPMRDLSNLTLGIIGYGTLGKAVAKASNTLFRTQTIVMQRPGGLDHRPGRVHQKRFFASADIVTLHCPLSPETRGLIGPNELGLMKNDALLINTARGGIIDELALAQALRNGKLGGAGIDCLSTEPPPENHPLTVNDIPNLIVTPHIAWASRESRQRLLSELVANIRAYRGGRARNLVVSLPKAVPA